MKRNSLVVLGLSAVLGFGLFGIGCSDDSKPKTTDAGTDAKGIDGAVSTGGAKGTGGATGAGGVVGTGGALDGGGGTNTGGVTGTGGSPSTGGATGTGGSTVPLDGGRDSTSPDLKGIDGSNVDGADAPINGDLPPVIVDGGVDAPDTSITPVDTGIDMGAVDGEAIDGQGLDGGID